MKMLFTVRQDFDIYNRVFIVNYATNLNRKYYKKYRNLTNNGNYHISEAIQYRGLDREG